MDDLIYTKRSDWHIQTVTRNAEIIAAALVKGAGCTTVAGGRGSTFTFPTSDCLAYLRRYRRGGAMHFLVRDKFFLDNRAHREFELLRELKAEGLAVPEALGAVWRSHFGFYEGALATGALDGENLYDYLRNTDNAQDATLRAAGAVIRRMHDLRVWHADLQIRNIMVCSNGVFLIDFDNARRLARWRPNHSFRNLLRLKRSFEKAGLPESCFDTLCAGYGDVSLPAWLCGLYGVKHFFSDLMRGQRKKHG